MGRLVLIRGISGSGKTTAAKTLFPDYALVEADDYFLKDGVYKFDSYMLPHAHEESLLRTKMLLEAGHDVVVANTLYLQKYVEPYLNLNDDILIIRTTGHFDSLHIIDQDVLRHQFNKFENLHNEILTDPEMFKDKQKISLLRDGIQPEFSFDDKEDNETGFKKGLKKHIPSLSWVEYVGKHDVIKVPYYRNQYNEPVSSFISFMMDLCTWKHDRTPDTPSAYTATVNMYAYALKDFLVYLSSINLDWKRVTDFHLVDFRDKEVARISGGEFTQIKKAKRTVNRKLMVVYNFLGWSHSVTGYLSSVRMGSNSPYIYSTIPEIYDEYPTGEPFSTAPKGSPLNRGKFPKLFRDAGVPTDRYTAKTNDVIEISKFFANKETTAFSEYILERNILMLLLIDEGAVRAASLGSILCSQFKREKIDRETGDDFAFIPPHQKGDKGYTAKISKALAYRVADFIEFTREEFIDQKGITEKSTEGSLLLSTTTCKGLSAKRISEIFQEAFKACGIRAGAHALRRKSAVDYMEEDLEWRIDNGLVIDPLTVTEVARNKLQQSTTASTADYLEALDRAKGETAVSELQTNLLFAIGEINDLRMELKQLKIRNSKLEKENEKLNREAV